MQPDVSFVIAAYNAEACISRAIESALAQQGVSVEVIVVDDCSRDRTVEIARAFAPRGVTRGVTVVALPRNRGPGGARNAGLDAATGRWIAVLDSDDSIHPDRMRRLIDRAGKAGAQIAIDNLEVVEDASAPQAMFERTFLEARPELHLADFIDGNIMFQGRFSFGYVKPVFRRDFLERHALRYDEALRIGEDYILLASGLAAGGRCAVEPGAGYRYHIRGGSLSRVLELHHVEAMLAADDAFRKAYRLDPQAEAALARRTRSLRRAASFLLLVRHLKDRAPLRAAGTALRDPAALRHLGMPVMVRLRRLAAAFHPAGKAAASRLETN